MTLNKILTLLKNIIFQNETKRVDDVNFHSFSISFNRYLEYFNVNIRISNFHIGWILQLLICNSVTYFSANCVTIGGYHSDTNICGLNVGHLNDPTSGLDGGPSMDFLQVNLFHVNF
jgi:hypothetical protein